MARRFAPGVACMLLLASCANRASQAAGPQLPDIATNDNRTPAGRLRSGVLRIDLVAAEGRWFPERAEGRAHVVNAFGERGGSLRNPGPMMRVSAGTEVVATVRNAVGGVPLIVHGLHDRPGTPRAVAIASGATDTIRFRLTSPGTYYYWGSTRGATTLRDRWGKDTQLLGVIIADSAGTVPDEHVFLVGIEADSGELPALRHVSAAVINGLSWPHTPQFDIRQGDTVRTRWLNVSDRIHPIHLHGFYFQVDSRGDMSADTAYDSTRKRMVVTELLAQGQTMSAHWVAARPGNWLMHCHMTEHMSHELRSRARHLESASHNHSMEAMAGLVVGWRVAPDRRTAAAPAAEPPRSDARKIRVLVQGSPRRFHEHPALGFVIDNGTGPVKPDSVVIPGPPLVLTRDVPVEITVVNRLDEPTSIHWHGIELDSYFDGVSGWSGSRGSLAPHVAPRDSFVVRFTPPRSGTFIYHTHFAEERQLASGMYGALIVLEPGQEYDPERDRPLVFGQRGPGRAIAVGMLLNGAVDSAYDFRIGTRYRLRIININPNAPLVISLAADSTLLRWRAIAKDGADLPPAMATVRPASVRIGVGETYDFEFAPDRAGDFTLRAVDLRGVAVVSSSLRVR